MRTNVAEAAMTPEWHTFTSTAVREGDLWTVRCDQHADICTRVRLLSHAVAEQRVIIADVAGVPEDRITVVVRPELPENVKNHLARARRLRQTATWANGAAAAERRAAARALANAGYSTRDIGTILGVSHQRAHQLFQWKPPEDRQPNF